MRFEFCDCVLDSDARQLHRGGQPVHLSPKAYDLLEFLIAQRPRAIPKQTLYDYLWPDTFVVEANLPILIREVRVAVGDLDHSIIRTVPRHGYAFSGDTRPQGAATISAHMLVQGERSFPLAEGENVVGREPSAAVWIVSKSVSRRHALISVKGDRATIVDLKSKNGTCLSGVPLAGPQPLDDGSVVTFGAVEMIYRWCPVDGRTESIG